MRIIQLSFLTLFLLSCSTKNNNMGLFDKLFGKKDKSVNIENKDSLLGINPIEKTSEMLDEDLYWLIIENSLKHSSNQEGQEKYLINEISKLTLKQMIGFRLRTDKLLYDTYNSDMWCAGYIMNGGCSDDGFEYFRNWVISRGKTTYYKTKENPDYLINELVSEIEIYDFENFWYVALAAFDNKTGKDLYDYIDYEKFITCESNYPNFDFTWEENNPESMKKICPKLYEKFYKH